jgi:signal transduction histidine kinase
MAVTKNVSQKPSRLAKRHDWAIIGLRILFLLGAALAVFLARSQTEEPAGDYTDLAIAAGIGFGVTVVLAVSVLVKSLKPVVPFVLMGVDAVLVGAFVYVGDGDPMILIGAAGFLSVTGMLWLDDMLGALQAILVIAIALGSALYLQIAQSSDQSLDLGVTFDLYVLPLLIVSLLAIGVSIWQHTRGDQGAGRLVSLNKEVESNENQIATMKERMRSIYEMAAVLSGTLDFQQVLDAALKAGELSMYKAKNQRTISMVLLFRYDEEDLYVAGSRGLKSTDDHVSISGDEGIIAKALDECEPIFSDDIKADPELHKFAGLHGIRAVAVLPLHAHFDNFGVLIYGSSNANAFRDDAMDVLTTISVQATTALQNSTLYHTLLDEKELIYKLEEDARKALVRDLHDIPTQTIAAMTMRIRMIQRLVQTRMENVPAEIIEELDITEKMANRATVEIRHVLFKLRPLALETQGLVAALGQLAEKMQLTYKQACTVKISDDIEQYLDETKQGAMFYLIEEAMNNARKYAEAAMITVQASLKNGMIALKVSDNGKGFDVDGISRSYSRRGSFGMVNMKERADALNGIYKIDSRKGKGTVITVMIPIDKTHTTTATGVYRQVPKTKLAASTQTRLEN